MRWLALAGLVSIVMGEKSEPVLLLGWREFDLPGGVLDVKGVPLRVKEVPNSGKGTGLVVWDGSVVLSKFLEHAVPLEGKKVVELGAGTGIVSMTCAVLGAAKVMSTDLEYVLGNLRDNVAENHLQDAIDCFEMDWFAAESSKMPEQVDYILGADVVWVPELVPPFVETLKQLTKVNPNADIILSHQTRALKTDNLLFDLLAKHGVELDCVSQETMHPKFQSKRIKIYRHTPKNAPDVS